MGNIIGSSKDFESDLRKYLDKLVGECITWLKEEEDYHLAIHNTRRNLKKIRAVWRLVRFDLEKEDFAAKNQFYRDQARHLSDLRDATALLETLELLRKHFGEAIAPEAFTALEGWLQEERAELADAGEERPAVLLQVAADLEANSEPTNAFKLKGSWLEGLAGGLKRVYQRGRQGCGQNADALSREAMHEWRKRAKYLRYHLEILEGVWPEMFAPWAAEMHRLTDLLGEYNNLAVLKDKLTNDPGALPPAIVDTALAITSQEQEDLYQNAIHLGRLLFAEKPGAFSRRMIAYLELF